MKRIFLALTLFMGLSVQAAEQTASMNIDSRVKYQHVTGFGGFSPSPQWQYWLGDNEMNKLFGKADNQLGLNIVRLYISTNKGFWGSSVANAKNAKKNGAFIFASPWSPPAAWKSNGTTGNGGKLLREHWEDWANYLNDYYKYMKQQGVTIDAVSIQNEPDWNTTYESCIWTGEEMAEFLKLYGHLIECKVIAPEAIHFTKSLHEPILNDAEACKQLDIVGGHFYGWDGSSYPLATQKGKEVWMTEYLINERQQNNGQNIDWQNDGFLFARSINDAMLANMSAWVHYSLKRYYGCLGDGDYGTTNNEITKRGYILSHYAKYVSGTTRIRHAITDAQGKLSGSAYLSQTGDSVVVMVINPSSSDIYNINFTLPFYTKSGFRVVTTGNSTANAKKANLGSISETYEPSLKVAASSINTFVFVKSKAREDLPEGGNEEEGIVFKDDFDLYGASCIPNGWTSKSDGETRYAGSYSLGPRIMGFSPEGAMQYAFYFRSGSRGAGLVSYGEDSNYPLYLEPGKYTLTYSIVGYKALPNISAVVLKEGTSTPLANKTTKPTVQVSDNGASVRIPSTTGCTLDFEITTAGKYVMRFGITKTTSGYSEALMGNIRLAKQKIEGDVNGDNAVDVGDVTAVVNVICGGTEHKNDADINNDGKIDIDDVTKVINIICGN